MKNTTITMLACAVLAVSSTCLAEPSGDAQFSGASSGLEGRERELGLAMGVVLKTMHENESYVHELNDALVKSLLSSMQFAKNNDMIDDLIAHEVNTLKPLLKRIRKHYQRTGDLEFVMVGMIDRTSCHYQLVFETESKPGYRAWQSPWSNVLTQTRRLGQHDLTEEDVHDIWVRRRLQAYANEIGVYLEVSPLGEDGRVWVRAQREATQAAAQ